MSGRSASFAAAANVLVGTIERRKAAIPTVGASTWADVVRLPVSERAASAGIGKIPSSAGMRRAAIAVEIHSSAMNVTTERNATRTPRALTNVFAIPAIRSEQTRGRNDLLSPSNRERQ